MSTPAGPRNDADQVAVERARRKLARIKGFYTHLTIYCIVIGALFLINYLTHSGWWFYWPALGWGIGLALHAVGVFGTDALFGEGWEERKLRELTERERQRP